MRWWELMAPGSPRCHGSSPARSIRTAGRFCWTMPPIRLAGSREAIRRGIAMVTQETSLAPDLSVFENIMLPRIGMSGALHWRQLRAQARALVDGLGQGAALPLDALVNELSPRPAAIGGNSEGAVGGQPDHHFRRADGSAVAPRERASVRYHASTRGAWTRTGLCLAPAGGDLRHRRPGDGAARRQARGGRPGHCRAQPE